MSDAFQNFMAHNGILHHSSCIGPPSQNGVAKRKNGHLLDAVSIARFIINRMPLTVLNGDIQYSVLFPNKVTLPGRTTDIG